MDKKDKKIIDVLKENSRETIRDIAKKTKIRPSTVHNRMKKLEGETIEKYTVKLNNKKIGENFIVFILMSSDKEIPNSVFSNNHIKEVFGITGEHDLLLKCKFRDIEEFNSFILRFRKYPHVKKTITMVSTATIKEEI